MSTSRQIELTVNRANLPDDRAEIADLFKLSLERHGISKSLLSNSSIRHKITHGYKKSEQRISISGKMYCYELWKILHDVPVDHLMLDNNLNIETPVFRYVAAHSIGIIESRVWLEQPLNINLISDHFNMIISKAIAPIVLNCQTPVESVKYAMAHREVLTGGSKNSQNLQKWASHFGLDYISSHDSF
jgi:hypothetical protein